MYSSSEAGEFNVSITVRGEAIKDSPFKLTATEKTATVLSGTLSQVISTDVKSTCVTLCVRQWYSLHIELKLNWWLPDVISRLAFSA